MAIDLPPPPGLASFRANLPTWTVERSTEYLIALFRRRQIRGSKPSALATAWLLRKVVSTTRATDPGKLIIRVQEVGRKLVDAAPRELTVGNIVRRVLGAISEEQENRDAATSQTGSELGSFPPTPAAEPSQLPRHAESTLSRPTLFPNPTGTADRRPVITSMFSIMSHPTMRSADGALSPMRSGSSTPAQHPQPTSTDFRAEVLEAITEIVDELDQADEQIASYALENIAANETIFTYSSSPTVQKFLLKAASKRKFTLIQAEAYPNDHRQTHAAVAGTQSSVESEEEDLDADAFSKPLAAAGIQVILIPDNAIFAVMPRANKVILSAHAVMVNGSLTATAGAKSVCQAAKFHKKPVLALASTYKLCPLYPHDPFDFIDYGDVQQVVPYQDRELQLELSSVRNPITDFIESQEIDLFVTNVGGISPEYLYRVVRDQYRDEDIEL